MANFKLLIVAASLYASGSAFAGYAQLAAPSGWTGGAQAMMQGTKQMVVSGAANASYFNTTATVNVGGRAIVAPASMRIAANAGRFLAPVAFMNPALMVASAAVMAYYLTGGFEVQGNTWIKKTKITGGTEYCASPDCRFELYDGKQQWMTSPQAAGAFRLSITNTTGLAVRSMTCSPTSCFVDLFRVSDQYEWVDLTWPVSSRTAPEQTKITAATPEEMETFGQTAPMPSTVITSWPLELPPLPVEKPLLNPSPDFVPQPLRVPQGEPQLIPGSNPQQWRSPVVDIVPAPTVTDPWRVDLQPKDVIKTDPAPLPESAPVPVTPPAGQTEAEKTPDLCEKNPDILACQKLDTPTEDALEKKDKTVTVNPDSGWGASDSACPAPKSITVNGRVIQIPYDLFCQYMHGIRPVVISMAWLSAGFILLGVKGGD